MVICRREGMDVERESTLCIVWRYEIAPTASQRRNGRKDGDGRLLASAKEELGDLDR